MKRTKVTTYNGAAFSRPASRRTVAPFYRLEEVNGEPHYRECSAAEVINAGIELSERQLGAASLNAPASTRAYLHSRLAHLPYEMFAVLLLDNRHRLIEYRELFRGTIDGASVHPREVVRDVMAVNAAAVIFAHNHPSGVAEPSQADEMITRRLRDALALVDVRVLDHILVAGTQMISFAERGLM